MELNKNKSIFILSLAIVFLSVSLIYLQRKNIEVIEDSLNPAQKELDRRCLNFDRLVGFFDKYSSEEKITDKNTPNLDKLVVRTSDNSPFFSFNSLRFESSKLDEDKKNKILVDFKKNIEPEIKKIGLIKEYSYSNFSNLVYQYRQEDNIYTISIPTNSESPITLDSLIFNCGQTNPEDLKIYSLVSSKYKKDQILDIWENTDNVLKISVGNLNSVSGYVNLFDLSKKNPELIYEGQETIDCSVLEQRNIGKGLDCLNASK